MAATSEHPLTTAVGLYDHYSGIREVTAYYGVLGIYALARTAEAADSEEIWSTVEHALRRFPDQVEHPRYNFASYRIGGIAQSFAFWQGRMGDRRDLVVEYAEELMTAPRDPYGVLTKINEPHDKTWIDVAMAATPYLLHAGLALDRQDWIAEAIHQSVAMYDDFLDPDNGLLHQCRGFVAPGVLSTDHWGRGNGWGHFGLAELVRDLPRDHPRWDEVAQRFRLLSEALLPYQSESGLWRQEIPMESAWEESSGTGLFAYGFGVGMAAGVLERDKFAEPLARAIHGLAKHAINPDHSTELSCPGTLAPGEGELKGTPEAYVTLKSPYRDEPHGFAPLMLALTRARDVGIDRVVIGSD